MHAVIDGQAIDTSTMILTPVLMTDHGRSHTRSGMVGRAHMEGHARGNGENHIRLCLDDSCMAALDRVGDR